MTKRILIMGLPGSGKTVLAQTLNTMLIPHFKGVWLNADRIREEYDDWDFSYEGRVRQSRRMRVLAGILDSEYVIADFVCPLKEMRDHYDPHYTIWMDTITSGRYEDTNSIFQPPEKYDYRVTSLVYNAYDICEKIIQCIQH